jgi:hypothetical protein
MDPQAVLQMAQQDPSVGQAVDMIESQLGGMPVAPEGIQELVQMLQFALQKPEAWPEIRQAAIADDLADEEDLPPQFDPTAIMSLLVALQGLQQRGAQQPQGMPMAHGGLAQMARAGRMGDTMLAHITPEEAAMLRQAGGAGSINPATGLPEYFKLKKLLKMVAPIALAFLAPGIGSVIGSAFGATGTAASMLGQAVIGGASAGLSGGNALQGAILGGMTGGLGGSLGASANEALKLGLGATGQSVLGGGLTGAAAAGLTGGNPLKGAAIGALGTAAMGSMSPSDAVVAGMRQPSVDPISGLPTQSSYANANLGGLLTPKNMLMGATALSALGGSGSGSKPGAAQPPQMSPERQEYFNRPQQQFDWNRMMADASAAGMDLSQFMAQNWNSISGGAYNQPVVRMAMGGALTRMAMGGGSGRDDTIPARLSDGEYVMDAETVALLGDGSNKEGARRLDAMRERLREHKGQTLARGEFSPDAKSPLAYLQGVM